MENPNTRLIREAQERTRAGEPTMPQDVGRERLDRLTVTLSSDVIELQTERGQRIRLAW